MTKQERLDELLGKYTFAVDCGQFKQAELYWRAIELLQKEGGGGEI